MTKDMDLCEVPHVTLTAGTHDVFDEYGLRHSFGEDPEYDEIVELAQDLTDATQAMIVLVRPDEDTVTTRVGRQAVAVPKEHAFTTVTTGNLFTPTVVGDATRDPRFAGNPFVTGGYVRAYLGVTILSIHDEPLAALEVVDTRPRDWTPRHVRHVTVLGHMVQAHLELRRLLHEAVVAHA